MNRITVTRRHMFQLATVVVILIIAVLMFVIGRQHTILLDNKTIEHAGTSYPPFSIVTVEVDKEGELELAARDRDKAEVMGQRHKIRVVYTDKFFEEHEVIQRFKVPLGQDMVLISLPALVAQLDESVWMQDYFPPTAAVAPQAQEPEPADDLGVDLGTF